MAPQKRARDDLVPSTSALRPDKTKKAKRTHEPGSYNTEAAAPTGKKTNFGSDGRAKEVSRPVVMNEEVDYPRGGGVSLEQPNGSTDRMEVEGEGGEVFADGPKKPKAKRKSVAGRNDARSERKNEAGTLESETVRVEHLNYKRLEPGQKLLGQITSILPLALIVSLPNQLMGHIPIVNVSPQLTSRLESSPSESSSNSAEEDEDEGKDDIPSLTQLFTPGQYLPCTVKQVRSSNESVDLGARPRDDSEKMAKRVELSIRPKDVNAGVSVGDIRVGSNMLGAIESEEDHGYTVDFGMADISGFVPATIAERPFRIGQVITSTVTKLSENKRLATLSVDSEAIRDSYMTEASSQHALLPGTLASCLVTAVVPSGLNVQIVGFFQGTIDLFHLPEGTEGINLGDRIRARILCDIPGSSPPRFILSMLQHVTSLTAACTLPPPVPQPKDQKKKRKQVERGVDVVEAYPVGMILDSVSIVRVEGEWGLVCRVGEGVQGFAHISRIADTLVPVLSSTSGTWRVGSAHRARVIGHHALDGLVLLSLQPSVLELIYMRAEDVSIGEIIKGKVVKLKESGLVVALSDKVCGFATPDHYADIKLKHPERKFKEGASVKCRVLNVDTNRNQVRITLKKTLIESTLPLVTSFDDAQVGMLALGVVQRIDERFILLGYYGGVRAIVPLSELTETQVSSTAGLFTLGQVVKSRIISVDRDAHKISASIRRAAPGFRAPVDVSSIQVGATVSGTVTSLYEGNAVLSLDEPEGAKAFVSLSNLANSRETTVPQLRVALEGKENEERIENLTVVSVNVEKALVIVSATRSRQKSSGLSTSSALRADAFEEGKVVSGRVGPTLAHGTLVRLSKYVTGRLHSTDICDDYTSLDAVPPTEGKVVDVAVIRVNKELKQVDVSLRKSRLEPSAGHPIADREIESIGDLKSGQNVRGIVKSVVQQGVFVSLGRDVTGRLQIRELFDEYVKDWQSPFSAGRVVSTRVLSVNASAGQVELTMRSGDINKLLERSITLSDLRVGQKIEGRVKSVVEFGLFVEVAGTKISGLCHKSEISDNKKADVAEALKSFREDDMVKAVVLSIDKTNRKISFGVKPSYFADDPQALQENNNPEDVNESEDEGESGDSESDVEMDQVDTGEETDPEADDTSEDEESSEIEVDDSDLAKNLETEAPTAVMSHNAPALPVTGGFSWSAQTADPHDAAASASDAFDSDPEDDVSKTKKKKKKKPILQDLTADLRTKVPESTADFERVLLSSPDSSFLWIRYMSFQLQLSEVEKAREIGRRALQTINYREEREKLNVWTALLNLENQFGTDESLEALFRDAARHNDSKTVHLRLAAIYEESEKAQKAEEQYARTAKKFSQSSKVWTLFGEHYLKAARLEEARKLLSRSLLSLPQRKHLKTISTFARMEYRLGDPERGKTIFEGIIESHPKRNDLWSVYIDMEASQRNIQSIRNIFSRALSRKLTAKQAKFFFKKWLELERQIGDEAGAEIVKAKATEWMQSRAGGDA